jgi:sugar phosphate isomerase/epimerase
MIRKAGFSATALWCGAEEPMAAEGRADEMAVLAGMFGLAVEYLHAPYDSSGQLWSERPEDPLALLAVYRHWTDYCARHSIPVLVIHLVGHVRAAGPTPGGMEVIARLVAHAAGRGVAIAVENTRQPELVDTVLEAIESPHLGLCYDSSHDALWGAAPGALLCRWRSRLAATHFSDNAGARDDHWLPGDGTIAWEPLMRDFPSASYRGAITLEAVPRAPCDEAPERFLQRARERVEWLAGLAETAPSG